MVTVCGRHPVILSQRRQLICRCSFVAAQLARGVRAYARWLGSDALSARGAR